MVPASAARMAIRKSRQLSPDQSYGIRVRQRTNPRDGECGALSAPAVVDEIIIYAGLRLRHRWHLAVRTLYAGRSAWRPAMRARAEAIALAAAALTASRPSPYSPSMSSMA